MDERTEAAPAPETAVAVAEREDEPDLPEPAPVESLAPTRTASATRAADDDARVAPADESEGEPGLLQADLLETSFALLAPRAEELVDRFYFRLFRAAPEAYHMFPQDRFGEQKKKLLSALKLVVNNARKPEAVVPVLGELGAKHVQYGVRPEHYPLVGSILLATLGEFAGDAWTDELRRAWAEAYGVVAAVMLKGAAAA